MRIVLHWLVTNGHLRDERTWEIDYLIAVKGKIPVSFGTLNYDVWSEIRDAVPPIILLRGDGKLWGRGTAKATASLRGAFPLAYWSREVENTGAESQFPFTALTLPEVGFRWKLNEVKGGGLLVIYAFSLMAIGGGTLAAGDDMPVEARNLLQESGIPLPSDLRRVSSIAQVEDE